MVKISLEEDDGTIVVWRGLRGYRGDSLSVSFLKKENGVDFTIADQHIGVVTDDGIEFDLTNAFVLKSFTLLITNALMKGTQK